jgi:hypothetical protein
MAYGTLKVDNLTYTSGGSDATTTVSGLLGIAAGNFNNITATGTISGATITGNTAQFNTVTGNTSQFTTITAVTGIFTTTLSGATVLGPTHTGSVANFNSANFTSTVTGTTFSGTTINAVSANFTTSITGVTVTGITANFSSGNFTTQVSGATTRDSKGDVRSIPANAQSTSYTLVIGDAGRHISTTAGVTVPASVFSTGDAISIYNNSASSITITQGASVTLRQGGTANTGNRTLLLRGVATILCVASNEFVINGNIS